MAAMAGVMEVMGVMAGEVTDAAGHWERPRVSRLLMT
jgi:hypothetical protein